MSIINGFIEWYKNIGPEAQLWLGLVVVQLFGLGFMVNLAVDCYLDDIKWRDFNKR